MSRKDATITECSFKCFIHQYESNGPIAKTANNRSDDKQTAQVLELQSVLPFPSLPQVTLSAKKINSLSLAVLDEKLELFGPSDMFPTHPFTAKKVSYVSHCIYFRIE